MGVPIRLIRTDGEKIPLMAESITMTVDRSVGSMPIPFKHSGRIGLDMNRSKAAIVITGVIVDDGKEHTGTGVGSSAFIDFARTDRNKTWFKSAPLVLNAAPLYNKDIMMLGKDGVTFTFRLTNLATLATSSGHIATTGAANDIVSVPIGNAASAANVATALALAMNQTTHPTGRPYRPGNYFTATVVESNRDPTQGLTKVNIVQNFDGAYGGTGPVFGGEWYSMKLGASPLNAPLSLQWKLGHSDVGPKSAGDKAMDLYGSFNNMNNSNADFAERFDFGQDWGDTYEDNVDDDDDLSGDYIIGIQIPYNSMVTAAGGEDYTQRNFWMPTGKKFNKDEKGSEANTKPVDVDFHQWNHGSRKGIKGTVQQFVMTYDAGETVYGYQLTFLPIDYII